MNISTAVTVAFVAVSTLAVPPAAFSQKFYGQMFKDGYGKVKDLSPTAPEAYRVEYVGWLLSLGSPVTGGRVQLERMGDEAAVALMKILGTRSALEEKEIQTALDILKVAFERPEAILEKSNRTPRATYFLLQYLDATNQDQTVKSGIAAAKSQITSSIPPK